MRNWSTYILLLVLAVATFSSVHAQGQERVVIGRDIGQRGGIKLTGRITDQLTGEPLVGATVRVVEQGENTQITNLNGNFELLLSRADYLLEVRYVGYETLRYPITAVGDGRMSLRMQQEDFQLEDVVIFGRDPEKNIRSTALGAVTLSTSNLKELPPFLGEVDIIRSMATLPGVSQVGEAAAGLNVRGGGADQNLFLFAGAPIYNPTHLFGLFTAFNPDIVNDFTLFKAVVPAQYGGRGASILTVTPKTGSLDTYGGSLMLSTISGKATLNGPVVKDKVSFQLGARGSYINWLLGSLNNPELRTSQANFYDVNALLYAELSEEHQLTYSFYDSYDDFALASDTTISWKNRSHSLQYEGQFSERFRVAVTAHHTDYTFSIANPRGAMAFDLNSGIRDQGLRVQGFWQLTSSQTLSFGGDSKRLKVAPGDLLPGPQAELLPVEVQREFADESGLFFQHEMEVNNRFGLSYGLRYDHYRYLGPRNVRSYAPDRPIATAPILEETVYAAGETIETYSGWGPRVSFRYNLNPQTSLKGGYNRMFQFIHLISNTATIAPTDVWKLSDSFLRPQTVDQFSLGLFKNFKSNIFETSLEVYYKDMQNSVEYIDGANLILQNHLETELLTGRGRAYGAELFIRKNLGRTTGWLSYTYSRSERQVISPFEEFSINRGEWFPSNFDKPHELTLIGNYKLSALSSFSATFTYSTGRPITFPVAKFDFAGNALALFTDRNQQRIPDFHRLDVGYNFKFNGKSKFADGDWTFSVMNVYGRRNPFSLFFADQAGAPPQAFRLAILGIPFPSLSYSLQF